MVQDSRFRAVIFEIEQAPWRGAALNWVGSDRFEMGGSVRQERGDATSGSPPDAETGRWGFAREIRIRRGRAQSPRALRRPAGKGRKPVFVSGEVCGCAVIVLFDWG